jgi:hypothetical protein
MAPEAAEAADPMEPFCPTLGEEVQRKREQDSSNACRAGEEAVMADSVCVQQVLQSLRGQRRLLPPLRRRAAET